MSPGIQHHMYTCCIELLKALEAQRSQQELWGNQRRLHKERAFELGPLCQKHSFLLTKEICRVQRQVGAGGVQGVGTKNCECTEHEVRLVRKHGNR